MERFVHYIITSFNWGVYKKRRYRDCAEWWVEDRIRLFEKYTLPGMRAQTNQDFRWVLIFDPSTPEIPNFDYDNIIYSTTPSARDNVARVGTEWLITTRIDSDDYFEPTFIEEIQRCFNKKEVLVDIGGRQLDDRTGKFYEFPPYKCNSPFISLIEKRPFKGIKCHNHGDMKRYFKTKYINKKLAVQVVHDNNLMNRLTNKPCSTTINR